MPDDLLTGRNGNIGNAEVALFFRFRGELRTAADRHRVAAAGDGVRIKQTEDLELAVVIEAVLRLSCVGIKVLRDIIHRQSADRFFAVVL